MWQWILLFLLVAGIAILQGKFRWNPLSRNRNRSSSKRAAARLPVRLNKYFLSAAEQSFFRVLKAVATDDFEIFAKVRFIDVLWLPAKSGRIWPSKKKLMRRHLDFVLCDRRTLWPALAIELDDSSHQHIAARQRDEFKNRVLKRAGLPLLRINVQSAYDKTLLSKAIYDALGLPTRARPEVVGPNLK